MNNYLDRISHFRGTPREIGVAAGRTLGKKFEKNLQHYVTSRQGSVDTQKMRRDALPWLQSLPKRFLDEFEGIAEGTGIPLESLAEWAYIDECELNQCSGAICRIDNQAWVIRNNDTYVPDLWGFVTIREVDGRIPTISFCMEGDVFTPTGINKEKLWLHHQYLSAIDLPNSGKPHYPGYIFLSEALEVCRTINDVEALLHEIDRDAGMLLFALDGKTGESAIFECTCTDHRKRNTENDWIVGTNHYCVFEDPLFPGEEHTPGTLSRFLRMESMLQELINSPIPPDLPGDLIRILADDEVERRGEEFATAYANVACPGRGEIWYTFGGYPAASAGNWQRLKWPWLA